MLMGLINGDPFLTCVKRVLDGVYCILYVWFKLKNSDGTLIKFPFLLWSEARRRRISCSINNLPAISGGLTDVDKLLVYRRRQASSPYTNCNPYLFPPLGMFHSDSTLQLWTIKIAVVQSEDLMSCFLTLLFMFEYAAIVAQYQPACTMYNLHKDFTVRSINLESLGVD